MDRIDDTLFYLDGIYWVYVVGKGKISFL